MLQQPALGFMDDRPQYRLLSIISDTNLDIQRPLFPQDPSLLIFPFPRLFFSLEIKMPKKVR